MYLSRAKLMRVALSELINDKLVKGVLEVLEVAHVAARAEDGVRADGVQAGHVLEAREGAVRRERVRREHHAVLVLDREHARTGDDGLSEFPSTSTIRHVVRDD